MQALCALEEGHALRIWCDVEVSPPNAVEVEAYHAETGEIFHRTTSAVASSHSIPVLWAPSDTPVRWSVRTGTTVVEGELRTLPLPLGVKLNAYTMGASDLGSLLFPSPCLNSAYGIISDTQGEVRWYQQLTEGTDHALVESITWTESGTALALLDRTGIVEVTVDGQTLLRVPEPDPDREWHHDAFRRNGYTYVLFKETVFNGDGDPYLVDGVDVLDGKGARIASWSLTDHVPLPSSTIPESAPVDWSHANSIWVSTDGMTGLVSLRHLSTIVAFRADPEDPLFGQIAWTLAGSGPTEMVEPLSLESTVSGATDFQEQHYAHLDTDGRLVLLDNRESLDDDSRVLVVSLNLDQASATIETEYPLPVHCPYQGAAYRTDAGVVATCAPHATAYELDGGAVPPWSMEVACAGLATIFVPRFEPVPR